MARRATVARITRGASMLRNPVFRRRTIPISVAQSALGALLEQERAVHRVKCYWTSPRSRQLESQGEGRTLDRLRSAT
jgi:hypothetical protein